MPRKNIGRLFNLRSVELVRYDSFGRGLVLSGSEFFLRILILCEGVLANEDVSLRASGIVIGAIESSKTRSFCVSV